MGRPKKRRRDDEQTDTILEGFDNGNYADVDPTADFDFSSAFGSSVNPVTDFNLPSGNDSLWLGGTSMVGDLNPAAGFPLLPTDANSFP